MGPGDGLYLVASLIWVIAPIKCSSQVLTPKAIAGTSYCRGSFNLNIRISIVLAALSSAVGDAR
jgi:hypothetical protein